MPVFAQRRLNLMLAELAGLLTTPKHNDLKARLRHIDTRTALAAEAELSILWAVSRVAHLDPEPTLSDGHRPEGLSNDLFPSGPVVFEVRALSDDSFSGKEAMDRTANIIAGYADRLCRAAGKHLYFEFNERSYWMQGYHRERCVDPQFALTPEIKEVLRSWIMAADWPNPPAIRITTGKTDVVISWKPSTVLQFRTFCRMPPVAYNLEDNPIYKALKKKKRQVRGAAAGLLRCVILVDAGCDLLRRLRPLGAVHEIGGEKIIQYAIHKFRIDVVLVFSPYRQQGMYLGAGRSPLIWNVTCFDRRNISPVEYDRVKLAAAQLPRPLFEGYQARAMHQQGGFASNKGNRYLPTHVTTQYGVTMTIKLSAALLHEYLSGAIDAEKFKAKAFSDQSNYFAAALMHGNGIRNVHFESGGIDRDDDYVVFEMGLDESANAPKRA